MPRHDQRDILDELLKGTTGTSPAEDAELGRLLRRKVSSKEAQPEKPNKVAARTKGGTKKKTTHYLSQETCGELESARERINLLVRRRLSGRVSKSKIVDQAIKMILREFDEQGENSPLIQEILRDTPRK